MVELLLWNSRNLFYGGLIGAVFKIQRKYKAERWPDFNSVTRRGNYSLFEFKTINMTIQSNFTV